MKTLKELKKAANQSKRIRYNLALSDADRSILKQMAALYQIDMNDYVLRLVATDARLHNIFPTVEDDNETKLKGSQYVVKDPEIEGRKKRSAKSKSEPKPK